MASQPRTAKLLSASQQKKSVKGVQKKNVAKNTLESPFALDWPVITAEHEEEIRSLLHESCSGLKKLNCKPPWKEVLKYKGAERKAYLREFHHKFLASLDPGCVEQNKEREEALSNLIFGYNAVMRALEKDCIVGILVKKNVEPSFIVKTFLPGCANKSIPLIPLNDLDDILKREETLAVPHACMVLGLKSSVAEDTNRFFPLYAKMCESVNVDIEDVSDVEQMESSIDNHDSKENKACQSDHMLTEQQIQSYYLKRTQANKRAFIPGDGREQKVDPMGIGSDFIGFGLIESDEPPALQMGQLISRHQPSEVRSKLQTKNDGMKEKSSKDLKIPDFSSLFLIDETGDQDTSFREEIKVKEEDSEGKRMSTVQTDQKGRKRKLKAKQSEVHSYISAKTKRIKNNPNRNEKNRKRRR